MRKSSQTKAAVLHSSVTRNWFHEFFPPFILRHPLIHLVLVRRTLISFNVIQFFFFFLKNVIYGLIDKGRVYQIALIRYVFFNWLSRNGNNCSNNSTKKTFKLNYAESSGMIGSIFNSQKLFCAAIFGNVFKFCVILRWGYFVNAAPFRSVRLRLSHYQPSVNNQSWPVETTKQQSLMYQNPTFNKMERRRERERKTDRISEREWRGLWSALVFFINSKRAPKYPFSYNLF